MTGRPTNDASEPVAAPPAPDLTGALNEALGLEPPLPGRRELREFFGSVTGFRARARQQYHRLVPAPIRSRRGLVVTCGILTLGGLVYQSSSRRPPSELPIELRAAWVTTAKSYADRGFWIGTHQVAFQIGPNPTDIERYNVTHIDTKSVHGDTVVYDIEYAVDGGTSRWSIRHTQLPQPAIVFVHQPQMTWTVKPDLHPPVR